MSKFEEYFKRAKQYNEDIPPSVPFDEKVKVILIKDGFDAALDFATEHFSSMYKDPDDFERVALDYVEKIKMNLNDGDQT